MRVGKGPPKPTAPQPAPALKVGRAPVVVGKSAKHSDAAVLDLFGMDPKTWRCKYGCVGSVAPTGAAYHHYQCPYWDREGKAETPF